MPIFSRRSFLKTGLIGGLALAATGSLYRAAAYRDAPGKFTLDDRGRAALRAIALVVLKDAIDSSSAALDAACVRVLDAIAGLPLATQREIQDMFGLLTLGPSRRFLVRLPDDWAHAKAEDVAAFLGNWRVHRFSLLQGAYQALHDLIVGSWYADESTWAAIGYPGPIRVLGN